MSFLGAVGFPLPALNAAVGENAFVTSGGDAAWRRTLDLTREQWAYLERMANTAHQREVADLRAAGLNPILSVRGSGAPVPNASSASAVNTGGQMFSALGSFVPAMRAAGAATTQAKASTTQANSASSLRKVQEVTEANKADELSSRSVLNTQQARKADYEADLARESAELRSVEVESAKATLDATKALAQATKSAQTTEKEIDDSWFGKFFRYMGRIRAAPLPFVSHSAKDGAGYSSHSYGVR